MQKTTQQILLGAAVAGLIGAGATLSTVAHAKASKVKCYGANACKGKGACKTAKNECKGHNACKGSSFVMMTEKVCTKKGGSTTAPAAPGTGAPAAAEAPKS